MASGSHKCPLCGQVAQYEGNPLRPFCGERCRLADLGRWASGTYRIPVSDAQDGQIEPVEPGEEGGTP